jgi:hypothetical protein
MSFNFKKQFFTSFLILLTLSLFGQISNGGQPFSFFNLIKSEPIPNTINAPSIVEINNASNSGKGPYCVGILKPTQISSKSDGLWTTNADGSKIWRVKIKSKGAIGLTLHYKEFFIPTGGEVFLYNKNKNHVIGKFTSDRNKKNKITHTQIIQGDETYIEYYQPAGITDNLNIQIEKVGYIFRGFEDYLQPFLDPRAIYSILNPKADYCQIDVACSPENNGWQEQIDAVIHYTFIENQSIYVCSASVLNNTNQDCTPYILSAWHCGEPNGGQNLSGWTWYWNYQKSSCQLGAANSNDPSKGSQTMINGAVKSSSGSGTLNNPPSSNQVAGSDFYLVELNSSIPISYNAYYAGWSKSNSSASSGVSIHHPDGSAKKISTYSSNLSSVTYNGGAFNHHWLVTWSSTTNGHGVTEGGSSGAPIFDQNGRVVGQLSGGSSFCTTPTQPDLFGKFSSNWTANGSNSNARLSSWLDPTQSNVNTLDGSYQPCSSANPLICNINTSSTSITVGSSVIFSDGSTGNPNSWNWNFDTNGLGGASPSSSSAQNPGAITFNNVGTYTVSLSANNGSSNCNSTVNITVTSGGSNNNGCDILSNIQTGQSLTAYPYGSGYMSGWNSYGDISKAESFTITGNYSIVKNIAVYLFDVNSSSNNATVDFNIWSNVNGTPGSILGTVSYTLSNLENQLSSDPNNSGIITATFPNPIAISGNSFFAGIKMNNFSSQDKIAIVTNTNNTNSTNTAWEQWASGNWYEYSASNGWGYVLAHSITAELGFVTTVSPDVTICSGDNTTLSAAGAGNNGTYSWDNNLGNGNLKVVSPSSTTTYTVTGTDSNGCSALASVVVSVDNNPTISVTPNSTICSGNNITLQASGAGNNGSYNWSNNLGNNSSIIVSPNTTTSYTVTGINSNGCSAQANVIVTVESNPTVFANANSTSALVGDNIQFNSNGSNAANYSWLFGDGNSSANSNPSHSYNNSGTFNVELTGYNTSGNCSDQDSFSINISENNLNIDETSNKDIAIIPNPNQGLFSIKFKPTPNKNSKIEVLNNLGELIQSEPMNQGVESIEMDLQELSAGVYYLKYNFDNEYKIQKFIINK